jgi:ubiquinone/menaquinone biosynthesis C-methylase UbiE
MLAAAGARDVVGMDAPQPSFAEAGRRVVLPNLRFEPVIGETLPMADRSADVVVCLDVLDQIARPEVLVRELRRILLPGGTVIVSIANRRQAAGGVLGRMYQNSMPAGMSELQLRALLDPCFGRVQLFGQSYHRAVSPSFELLRSRQRATPLRLLSQSLFSALSTQPAAERLQEGWVFVPGETATAVSLVAVAAAE